jgi:hypothetical protein
MRLTVGPLPPAVYWRRRAVVLGALLAIIIVFYSACGGSGVGAERRDTAASPSAEPPAGSPDPEPTGSLLTPETADPGDEPAGEDPGGEPGGQPGGEGEPGGTGQPAPPPDAPAGNGQCADEELDLRAAPAKTNVPQRTPVDIRLLIRNVSDRSCRRDMGADLQELRIVQGAETRWSSDHCGPARGSDVRTLAPGDQREFMVTWNGKSSSKCSGGVPSGAPFEPGEYQVIARLGTKHSAPVLLTVRPAG